MMAPRVMLLALLVVLLHIVSAFEQSCTHTSAKGDFYDLSPLSDCNHDGFSVSTADDGSFDINICNTVYGCSSGAAVCQDGNYNTGSSSNYSISDYSGGQGVTLTYYGGDNAGCPNNRARTTTLNFICDNSATTPTFSFIAENPTCAYNFNVRSKEACPKSKGNQIQNCPVYVYLMPHSHDDVGWIITIDEYYQSEVKLILDSVVASLIANPTRKFIYVEQAYFWRWWTDPNTSDQQRANLMTVYKNGQFEFVIGGWVMQDEACTTYGADIIQMTLGHQFLLNTFGARPTKGWQIDPFGASSVTPTLNKLSGFDAHIIDRVTYKSDYEASRRLQFNWQGSPSLGVQSQIFTHILDGGQVAYCDWLGAFNFQNNPVNPSNVASYAQQFYSMVDQRSAYFRTNLLLAPWGCDFAFQNAVPMFTSMDTLINYLVANEAKTHVYVKYATLSDYFTDLMAIKNVTYPTDVGGDFFTLDEDSYWSGYYTSRTMLKGIVRQGEAASSVVETLFSMSRVLLPTFPATAAYSNITTLRLAVADAQHHDGVTGTSTPEVVAMYENDLHNGMNVAMSTSAAILSSYITKSQTTGALSPNGRALLNIQAGQTVPVLLYNSLGWQRTDYVVFPVNTQSLSVVDSNNKAVASQVNPTSAYNATSKYNLFFQTNIPPFGFNTYFIKAGGSSTAHVAETSEPVGADTVLTNGYLQVTVSGTTGRISNITNKISGAAIVADQNILQYKSMNSGAYVFGPAGDAVPVSSQPPKTTLSQGPLVTEVYQVFSTGSGSYAKQNIRMYRSASNAQNVSGFIEFDFEIGVLPSRIEVVTAFSTSIQNQQVFSTDNNGFEFMTREGLFNVPIQGNYFPTIYTTFMRDNAAQLSIYSDRSRGASSLANGKLEVMLHRNPDMGDGFGPGLTDTDLVLPVIRVSVDTPTASPIQTRIQPLLLNFPLTAFFGAPTPAQTWQSSHVTTGQFISSPLPPNVHFLSLVSLNGTKTIFRLTHLFAVGEDPVYSRPVSVDIGNLFSTFKLKTVVETTLTANNEIAPPLVSFVVQLQPKAIRTFVVTF